MSISNYLFTDLPMDVILDDSKEGKHRTPPQYFSGHNSSQTFLVSSSFVDFRVFFQPLGD